MKKLFFLTLVLAAALTANAQFTFYYNSQALNENSEVTITSNGDEAQLKPIIVNQLSRPVTARIRVLKTNSTNITVSSICTDQCVTSSYSAPFQISAGGSYADVVIDFEVPQNATPGTFKVIVMDQEDTTIRNSFNVRVEKGNNASVAEASLPCSFKAYPNPASGMVNISYAIQESDGQAVLAIYDLKGTVVSKTPIAQNEGSVMLDVRSLPAGIYVYGIKTDSGRTAMKKLIIR